MKLREWDHNAQGYTEVEYPDAPIKAFVDWFRTTKQWREHPEECFHRFMRFQRELVDAQTDAHRAEAAQKAPCSATTASGDPCKGKAVRDGLCIAHVKVTQAA